MESDATSVKDFISSLLSIFSKFLKMLSYIKGDRAISTNLMSSFGTAKRGR